MKRFYIFSLLLLVLVSCKKDNALPFSEQLDIDLEQALSDVSNGQGKSFFKLPSSSDLNNIPQDPLNPLTREKVTLGKLLYHETGIASAPLRAEGLHTYSCASCHHAQGGFQAGVIQGISEGGIGFGARGESRVPNPSYSELEMDIQPIRTPSALNIAYQPCVLWNGQFGATGPNSGTSAQWTVGTPKEVNLLGYEGVETQAIAGLGVHRLHYDTTSFIQNQPIYRQLFDYAFPNINVLNRYDREYGGLAIAAYERTLLASNSPFQRWLNGEQDAMSDQEKKGAILFFDKAACGSCHTGPALNSMAFYGLGMDDLDGSGVYGNTPDAATQKGRGGFTQNSTDDYKFKVPQLYNLKDSPHYGHGGSFSSVRAVVEYKNSAIHENQIVPTGQLASGFKALGLSDDEMTDLVKFIEEALYDDNLMRYVPSELPTGNCFPNADALSSVDLGCLN